MLHIYSDTDKPCRLEVVCGACDPFWSETHRAPASEKTYTVNSTTQKIAVRQRSSLVSLTADSYFAETISDEKLQYANFVHLRHEQTWWVRSQLRCV